MPSASGIRAGKAFVELGGNDAGLKKVLAGATMLIKGFGMAVVAVGTAAFAALTLGITAALAAMNQFAAAGGAMQDMSDRTGVATEALSTFKYAADQTGASIEDVEAAMRKVAKSGQFAGMSSEEAFRTAAEEVRGIEDPLQKSQRAMELFGKSGTKLIPMIDSLDELEGHARDLGLEMRSADAAAADAFGDAMGDLWLVVKDLVFEVGAALAPELTGLINVLAKAGAGAVSFIEQARPIIHDVFDAMVLGIAYVVTAFNNWDKILNALPTIVALALTTVWAEFEHLMTNLGIFGQWLGSNWLDILETTFTNATTIAYRFGELMGKILGEIAVKMVNPFMQSRLDIVAELSKLGEGLEPVFKDMPKFTERTLNDTEKQLRKGLSEMIGPISAEAEALADAWRGSLFGEDPTKKAKARVGDVPATMKDVKQKIDVQGSFNAATVGRMGASSLAERTAKATERVADNTKKILDELEDGETYD